MGYAHHMRGKKAVSPVVATLILILIAVAAAAALYLWLVAWQGGVTKGIGSPGAQYTVSIGGSTSAYPFAELAATQFEQNNSDVVISVNQGGSGAGAAAVCSGQVDIGQVSSFAYPTSFLTASDGCPQTVVEQIVAYDGVDLILDKSSTLGILNISWDTAQAIWTSASSTPAGTGATTTTNIYALGNLHMNGIVAPVQAAGGTNYLWDQLPACATADLNTCGGGGNPAESSITPNVDVAAAVPETGSSTITSAAPACTVLGATTITGTSVFTITGYISAATFTYPAITATGCTTQPTFAAPAASATISAVQTTGTTVTVTWSGSYIATAGTGAGTATLAGTAASATVTGLVQNVGTSYTVGANAAALCGSPAYEACAKLTVSTALNAATTGTSSCGFSVCAGSTHGIDLYYRSDVSGTTTGFLARVLAVSASGGVPSGLSYTGCGGDNEFDGCGLAFTGSTDHGEDGNPAVIAAVGGDPYGLGYASDGLSQAAGSGVVPINLQGYGQTVVVNIQGESTALKAIAKGISDTFQNAATYATDQAYVGWRPFINIETASPTGEAQRYLEFVLDPANNQLLATESAEISVYASGLAGVVPVTPVSGVQNLP